MPFDRDQRSCDRIAAHNLWARIEAIRRNREFVVAYRDARTRWLAGVTPRDSPSAFRT